MESWRLDEYIYLPRCWAAHNVPWMGERLAFLLLDMSNVESHPFMHRKDLCSSLRSHFTQQFQDLLEVFGSNVLLWRQGWIFGSGMGNSENVGSSTTGWLIEDINSNRLKSRIPFSAEGMKILVGFHILCTYIHSFYGTFHGNVLLPMIFPGAMASRRLAKLWCELCQDPTCMEGQSE